MLKGNGLDICFVLIELVGEDGSMIPAEDIPVTVTVSGAASLQGLGSARCISSERYTDATALPCSGAHRIYGRERRNNGTGRWVQNTAYKIDHRKNRGITWNL